MSQLQQEGDRKIAETLASAPRCRWCNQKMRYEFAPNGDLTWRCWTPLCGGCMCAANANFMQKLQEAIAVGDERLLGKIREHFSDEQWDTLLLELEANPPKRSTL